MSALSQSHEGFHVPSVITKQLKMNSVQDGRRRIRISSNFIRLMGFEPGQRIEAVPSIAGGFDVRPAEQGSAKVHQRTYNRARSNNPCESVIEFASSSLINSSFPPTTERFHVTMRQGQLRVRPIPNRVFSITRRFTGGVDIHCLSQAGFKSDVVLEYRPPEARDVAAGRSFGRVS